MLPDFECKIRWEFESPVVPLLNKIAPSDVFWLRNRGTSLRLDSTLASWKRFRWSKRRDMTTLFRGGTPGCPDGGPGSDGAEAGPSLCMLNHTKRTVADVTEGLNREEAGAVVKDLVSADVMQWDVQVDSLEVAEATTWFGQLAGPCEVNGWRTTRFDLQGSLGVVLRKKGCRRNCTTFEDYFGCLLPPDACLPELREEFRKDLSPGESSGQPSANSELFDYMDRAERLQRQVLADAASPDGQPDADDLSITQEELLQWPGPSDTLLEECDTRVCIASRDDSRNDGAFPMRHSFAQVGRLAYLPLLNAGAAMPASSLSVTDTRCSAQC